MAKYLIRVQLIKTKADEVLYERLHGAMEGNLFVREIVGEGGTWALPFATYRYEGDADRDEVMKMAKTSARIAGHEARILVVEYVAAQWSNLKAVD